MEDLQQETKKVLFKKTFSNCTKEVVMYCDDIVDDDELFVCFDYSNEYSNGENQDGNAFVELPKILNAYSLKSYEELASYYLDKFGNDENAWGKIIKEIKKKGLDPSVDEAVWS